MGDLGGSGSATVSYGEDLPAETGAVRYGLTLILLVTVLPLLL